MFERLIKKNQSYVWGCSMMGEIGAVLGLFAGLAIGGALLGIVFYVFVGYVWFRLFKKSGVPMPWLAFIPYGGLWPFFWTIKKSTWNVLWFIVPSLMGMLFFKGGAPGGFLAVFFELLVVIITLYWCTLFLRAYGMNPWWLVALIGLVIPVLNVFAGIVVIVLLLYMSFNSNVIYHPNFNNNIFGNSVHL